MWFNLISKIKHCSQKTNNNIPDKYERTTFGILMTPPLVSKFLMSIFFSLGTIFTNCDAEIDGLT